ncbi:UNVERIFIED_CONTAM: putative disease resistance protein [Sesamum angustifolium]|uniref:Disease resistance protein n=1 Tax=Sesamum angustifolium TaxID=2727405 RepID=A0AAW2IYZ6_9LAMI
MAVAAYASLVSLTDVLESIQHPARRHRLHLDKKQLQSLQQKVHFLQDFLELHSQRISPEMEDLARQLALVADEADDVIDFHVVNQLRERSQAKTRRRATVSSFRQEINKIVKKIDSITEKLIMVEEERVDVQEQQPIVSVSMGSTALTSSDKNTMVGFDELLLQVVDELTRDESNLQILPIVGMGGIGKTTVAQNAFDHQHIVNRFDIRIWFTISQQYSVREILLKYFPKDEENKQGGKTLKEAAKEYLKDLADRNLTLIRKWTRTGKIKTCGVHDILRELCFRESEREHLIRVPKTKWFHNSVPMEDVCFLCSHKLYRQNKIHLEEVVNVGLQSTTVILNLHYLDSTSLFEVWEMPKLRHFTAFDSRLPDPVEGQDSTVLENLSTLKLSKLESLTIYSHLKDIAFPTSLKKLSLNYSRLPWEKMTIIGSSLPNLEVLKFYEAFQGEEWSPIEGEFLRLKVLVVGSHNLERWGAEDIHFPNLHVLYLEHMQRLEIPLSIGDINALQSIHLNSCNECTINSAVEIVKDQKEKGNESLQVYVNGKQVDEEQVLLDSDEEQVNLW